MALFDDQDHFKLPYTFIEMTAGLTYAETGKVFKAVIQYCNDESIPDFTGECWDVWCRIKRFVDWQTYHPRWRGGDIENPQRDRNSPEYKKWREAIFVRDDYTCQCCGQRGGKINAHHIKHYAKYPELRLSLANGITPCEKCHKAIHRGEIECQTES